ncbi:MAG: RAMP superfamily CRISPR-associated protein [Candidatus Xenobiia bacterium LiM19]
MRDGVIVLEGVVKLVTPALIGSGRGDSTDLDVLMEDGKPLIPATSFVGVLRHAVSRGIKNKDINANFKSFWGFAEKKDGHQSAFRCSDLICLDEKPQIKIRDGIRIDNKTGIVKDKGKFDFQVIERGARFSLHIETDYNKDSRESVMPMMATIIDLLKKGKVGIGAKTNSGLGRINLIEDKCFDYDFSCKKAVINWLKKTPVEPTKVISEPLPLTDRTFSITAIFSLRNSIIVRSYPTDPSLPDSVSLKSGSDYVIPGTSLKGAIRARAERIVSTLGKTPEIVRNLFGYVDDENRSTKARAGRIRINESLLPRFVGEMQNRIKIDRFTGGTIETALFDSMPIFTDFNDQVFTAELSIKDYRPEEIGLMLLILKDLWTGDLAVGGEKNVGRGTLQGEKAVINWDGNTIEMNKALSVSEKDRKTLEVFVLALNAEGGQA